MLLELHIWGPAFGLPSIDAQCLATVYHFRKSLPPDSWSLIPSSDPNVSPFGELPALRNGSTWVAGFDNIVAYLRDTSAGEWDLDRNLTESQQADSAAFFSFLESRGQPLLDLCLYVSSDNYLNCTRRALGDILSWPNSWTVPHQLRAKAKKRSEHLGLSSLDVDTAQEDKSEHVGLTAHIPKSLRKPKQSVSSLLGRNMQKNRFRLDAVTADFLEPLSDKLGDNEWLIGESVSSVDCLAIGYLSLLQNPQLPQAWVKEALRTKYSRLSQWTQEETLQAFGPLLDVAVVLGRKADGASARSELPWQVPPERTLAQVLLSVLDSCISSVPAVGSAYSISEIGHLQDARDQYRQKQLRLMSLQRRREVYVHFLTSSFVVAGALGWLFYKGMLRLPGRVAKPRGRKFGEAGALLGLV